MSHDPTPSKSRLVESRRRAEEDLAALQRSLENAVGWAPRSKGPVLLLVGAAAGFALARLFKRR